MILEGRKVLVEGYMILVVDISDPLTKNFSYGTHNKFIE